MLGQYSVLCVRDRGRGGLAVHKCINGCHTCIGESESVAPRKCFVQCVKKALEDRGT